MTPVFCPEELRAALDAGLTPQAFPGTDSPIAERAVLCVDEHGARCPAFDRNGNRCRFYARRPLDCRLYPILLMYDADGGNVLLAADPACPHVERASRSPELKTYVDRLAALLDGPLREHAAARRGVIGEFKPWMIPATVLPRLSRIVCRGDIGLRRLTLSTRDRLTPFFEARPAKLAAHAFAPVRVWADLFDLHWTVEADRLILVASGNGPAFLIAPPLGPGPLVPAVDRGMQILRALNGPGAPAQVQEVDDATWSELAPMGFETKTVFREYVHDKAALASLAGRRYKGKRAARNYFEKHCRAVFRPFSENDLPACFGLYRRWWAERAAADPSPAFTSQLQASAAMFLRALSEAVQLGLQARVLEADGRIVACTAGFVTPGREQFAVLLEVADRGVKGAAAACFQRFCAEAESVALINAMTDSGLPSLAAAKEMYHPVRRNVSRVVGLP
jgi:Fe-S-cluster containining protein